VLAGLGLAGSLPFSPVSLGRNRVKERQSNEMIRRRRLGLTALSSPARVGFYCEVGIPLADSLIESGPTMPTVMTASQIASAVRSRGAGYVRG